MNDQRQLHHKTPCRKCPWRKDSLQGYLGGYTPEWYADVVQENQVPSCHLRDHGPSDPETAYCVGALHTASNGCIMPHDARERAARNTVGRNDDCFGHPSLFYTYHSFGQTYVSRLIRLFNTRAKGSGDAA